MRQIITLLAGLIFSVSSFAQSTGSVSGKITDQQNKPMPAATVSLLKGKDSSVVKFTVTDKTGVYQFDNVLSGQYLVSVTAVGHAKSFSKKIEVADKPISLETIELLTQTKSLGGVTVTSNRPLIEQKIDRTIVNVEASITNVGSNALEVLEKSPGVSIDKDGNISLKGKQGVQVYIDGRPSYLSGADLANYLRSLSSNQLDQIEIMTNPPAKYDAAGNAGIINIKTKKTKQFGYSGSISSTWSQGRYPKVSE